MAPWLVLAAAALLWAIAKLAELLGLARGMVLGQLVLLLGVCDFLQPCCVPLGVRSATRAAAMHFVQRRLARRAPAAVDMATKQPAVSSETTSDLQHMEEPAGVSPSNPVTTPAQVTEIADRDTARGSVAARLAGAQDGFISDDKVASAASSAYRYCESVDMTASESSGDEGDDEQTDEVSTKPNEDVQRVGSSTKSVQARQDAWTTAHVRYASAGVKATAGKSAEENLRATRKRTLSPELVTTLGPTARARAKNTATPCSGVKQAIKAFEACSLDSFRARVETEHTFTSVLGTKPRPDSPAASAPEKVVRSTRAATRAYTRTVSAHGWGAVAIPTERKIDVQQAAGSIPRPQASLEPVTKRALHLVRTRSAPSVISTKSAKEVSVTMASGEQSSKIVEGSKPSEGTLTHAEAMIKFFSELEERNRALCEASRVRGSSGSSSCSSVRTDPGAYTKQKAEKEAKQKAKRQIKSAARTDSCSEPAVVITTATTAAVDAVGTLAKSTMSASELVEVESETVLPDEVSEVVQSDPESVSRDASSHLQCTTSTVDRKVGQSGNRSDEHSEPVSLPPSKPSGVAAEPVESNVSGKVILEPEPEAGSASFGNPETPVVIEGDAAETSAEVTEDALDLEKLDNIFADVKKIVEPARESKSSSSEELKALTTSRAQVAGRGSPETLTGARNGLAYLMDLDDICADTNTTLNPVEEEKSAFPEALEAPMPLEDDATEDDSSELYTRSSEGLMYLAESDDAYNEARMMMEPGRMERSPTAAEEKAYVAADDDVDEAIPELSEELLALADAHVKTAVTARGMSRSEAMADFFRSIAEEDKRLHQYRHPVFFQVMSIQLRLRRFSLLPSELTGLPDFRSSYASSDDSMEPQPERVEL